MSRQYPDDEDLDYLIDWARRKIVQLTQKDQAANFINIAELARSVAFYLAGTSMILDSSTQKWLRRRVSDTYYALSDMRLNEVSSKEYCHAENLLIDTLEHISSYYEENGHPNPGSLYESVVSLDEAKKVWLPPSRWREAYPEEFDEVE